MIDPAHPDYKNTPVSSKRPCFGYVPSDSSRLPAVTIVTPFYNTGSVFHETAGSVLQQSFQQWEWLIVNDGSTDPEALAVLRDYRCRDPRIHIMEHSTNQGLSAARNTGFRAARAACVVQLDSDDLLEPTAVEKWLWFLESYPECAFVKGFTVGFGAQEYLWKRGFHNGSAFLEDNWVAPTSAIRSSVYQAGGGYDEAIREGLEDWDFWLRCANSGSWGGTLPEYLDWYRRRPAHGDRWTNWDNAGRQRIFHMWLRQRYPRLWDGGFPQIQFHWHMPHDSVVDVLPCENRLRKANPRLLLIAPCLTAEGAENFDLDVVKQLIWQGWEVTVVVTREANPSWLARFACYTPDVFVLPHFLRLVDYPRFLRYLIGSRREDVVLVSHSEVGYLLLPYLSAHFPEIAFVDLCHRETEDKKYDDHPCMVLTDQGLLDLHIVSSEHVAQWRVKHGANPCRISMYDAKGDPERIPVLLQKAIQLHTNQPRPVPNVGLGQDCATQAMEYVRLANVITGPWLERERVSVGSLELNVQGFNPHYDSWRTRIYFAIRRYLLPYYRAALERKDMQWLSPFKDRLKRALLN